MPEMIRFTCPACRQKLEADPQAEERIFDCPNCSSPVRIPDPEEIQEREVKAQVGVERQKSSMNRGKRLTLRAGCLVLTVSLLYILYLQSLPRGDVVADNNVRARIAHVKSVIPEADIHQDDFYYRQQARDSADHYYRQQFHLVLLIGGLFHVGLILLLVVMIRKSKWARRVLGLLSLVIPVVAAALCLSSDSLIPRYFHAEQKAMFIAATSVLVIACLVAAFVLLRSKDVVAFTTRNASAAGR